MHTDNDGYLDDLRKRMKVIWIDELLAKSLERIVPAKPGSTVVVERDATRSGVRLVALRVGLRGDRVATPSRSRTGSVRLWKALSFNGNGETYRFNACPFARESGSCTPCRRDIHCGRGTACSGSG